MTEFISCKEYAANLKEELKELCKNSLRQRCLTVIQIGDNKASNSYIKKVKEKIVNMLV